MSNNETYIVSGHHDSSVQLWNAKQKEVCFKVDKAHTQAVACVRMTQNDRYIVSSAMDDTVKVWDTRMQKCMQTFKHDLYQTGSNKAKFCLSPNGEFAICGSKNGNVVFYNIKRAETANIVQGQHKS